MTTEPAPTGTGFVLGSFEEGGVEKWALSKNGVQIKTWSFAPLWWAKLSCILHGRVPFKVNE